MALLPKKKTEGKRKVITELNNSRKNFKMVIPYGVTRL